MTFVKMMDVESYLNKLLQTDAIREDLLQHFNRLNKVLRHPACEIIPQLKLEVSGGYCLQISTRQFLPCPIPEEKRGVVSTRAFVPYDCTTPPAPRFFEEGIVNSFPNIKTRVNFLNKFYQCLMSSKMPHKVRKLVVAGPKDSGKTSWASIFHRLIPAGNIASITSERQFSGAMIKEDTQLVLVDEWSADTIQSDFANYANFCSTNFSGRNTQTLTIFLLRRERVRQTKKKNVLDKTRSEDRYLDAYRRRST